MINSEINLPVIGESAMPSPSCPAAIMKPSIPSTQPRMGKPSSVYGLSPAKLLMIEIFLKAVLKKLTSEILLIPSYVTRD